MSVPNWYSLALLSLASFRTWRLLSEDDLLDTLRRYVTRLGTAWKEEGDALPNDYRIKLAAFIACPWCLGAWIGAGWWGCWQAWPHGTDVAAALMTISALLAWVARCTSD